MKFLIQLHIYNIKILLIDTLETIWNQAYNFSWSGLITLSELHNLIFKEIFNDTNTNFNDVWNENEHSSNTYPSVHCGAISNLKAVENLAKINFEFSTVSESIQEATKFFKSLTNIKLNAEPTKLIISSEFQENLSNLIIFIF